MRRGKSLGLGVVFMFAALLVAAVVAFFLFVELYRVPANAMTPSLRPGDRILVLHFVGSVKPDRGEIVAYRVPGSECGSPVGSVFVHRVARKTRAGRFIVRGDNRRHSCDSRVFGPVRRGELIGEVVAVYWPPSRWGFR
jgi:signal peptidase I